MNPDDHPGIKIRQRWLELGLTKGELAQRIEAGIVDPEKLERSVAGEISLAAHVSPTESRKRIRTARDLHAGLDHLRRFFGEGRISARKVSAVVAATSHLDASEFEAAVRSWVGR